MNVNQDKTHELISELDRRLFALNNRLSLLEYREDLGAEVTGDLNDVRQRIRTALQEPSLPDAIRAGCSPDVAEKNPLLARKTMLLQQKKEFSRIELDESLCRAGDELRACISEKSEGYAQVMAGLSSPSRKERRQARQSLASLAANVEPACRRWSSLANDLARKHGYNNYAEAALASEGLTISDMCTLFAAWKRERLPAYRQLVEEVSGAGDLLYLLKEHKDRMNEVFERRKAEDAFADLLSHLKLSLDDLPVSLVHREVSFTGACYRVEPGRDVRIVVNSSLAGLARYFYLLHEMGHAMYYCYCPRGSELLMDYQVTREAIADMWTLFLRDEQFLRTIVGSGDEDVETVLHSWSAYSTLRLFLFMRDAMFTVQVLTVPDSWYSDSWRAVTLEWLELDEDSGAFDPYDFLHPLHLKNYVFGQVLSERALSALTSNVLLKPETVINFDRLYCRPGNSVPWQTKFDMR